MEQRLTIFDDADYVSLRERIWQIENVEEALQLLDGIQVAYQLSLWAVVDVIYYFQTYKPHLLPQLEAGLEMALNFERSQISQSKKVAAVFGDVSSRFPALSFTAHVQLAYATAYLDWDEIVQAAKEAEINAWSVKELRYRLSQLRSQKLINQTEAATTEKKQRGRPPALVKELEPEPEPKPVKEVEPEVDLRQEVSFREQVQEEEKRKRLTDVAIQAADAYSRYQHEFVTYLLEALGIKQWEFFWDVAKEMRRRLPMIATITFPKELICTTLSKLLEDLLKTSEAGEVTDEENGSGEKTEEI